MVTHNPLHRSGRAAFPHPAASGDDAKSPQGIGVTDAGRGQPAVDKPPHPVPEDSAILAAPRQDAMPEPTHLKPKQVKRRAVHGHPEVADVSTYNRAQPRAHFRDGVVHASPQLGFHLAQLRLQPRTNRLPQHGETSVAPLLPADMRKAEKVERLGLPLTERTPVFCREWAELHKTRLLGMQLQPELPKPLGKLLPEPLSIRLVLEPNHDVIGKPDDDHVVSGVRLPPCLDPEVEHVMEVDIRQERRCAATLRRSLLHPYPLPLLQHAGVQPFLNEPHDASVRNPVLDERHQPPVVDGIEEATDVHIEHPVHVLRQQSRVERIQRVMLTASWPEPVREAEEVGFVDGVQHLSCRAL